MKHNAFQRENRPSPAPQSLTPVSRNGFYGSRGRLQGLDSGVRRVAATFGKALYLTYSHKSTGQLVVESDAERLVAHMLTLDPRVRSFQAQPFTVDLIDRRIHRTAQALSDARVRHRGRRGHKFYTPDFGIEWSLRGGAAIEVKIEGYEGDTNDRQRIAIGREIIEESGLEFLHVVWPSKRRCPLKSNLPLLCKATRWADLWPSSALVSSVEAALERGVSTVSDLCKALSLDAHMIPVLLVSGVFSASIGKQLINGAMEIAPAYGDLSHLALLKEVMV